MKLILIDDDCLVVSALQMILAAVPEFEIAATANDGREALHLYREHRPDVLLMDIRMKEVSGLEAAAQILDEFPNAKILLLTTFSDDEYIVKALKLGAKGYLLKQDYQNIALFGVDSQDNKIKDKGSRTDCIIIASINKSTKKVKLMSIYRDTYVSIDGEYDKINAAYSYGGPELALRTINRNLDLNITDFATVNFKALADAVDVLGGIPLTINSEKELQNLNDYIGNMNHINGGNSPKFEKTGTYTFDGNQAVAYSRIRYMEGGDHARANHQRLVLEGIMNTAKKQPLKLGKLISTVLPQCKTSLSNDALTKLTLSMARCKIEDSQAYPFKSEDERYNGIYYGFPITAQTNVKKAHEYLFGTKDYKPTEELQKISAKIKVVTDYIGITE